ncbi:hypothetical protein GOV09_06295 [Candidatus Woesearchaeota archaeon]|nr:hypothetical protein [Candidatus Woesearchaeota archaeon]
MVNLSTIVTGINILLVVSLLIVYVKNFKKVKSLFTLGLILFALLFLIQNIFSFYFAVTSMMLYAEGISNYVMIFSLLQTAAFIILNIITWR